MTPYEQARAAADKLGMDFDGVIRAHFAPCHYVYSSPECFILAYDTYHDDGGLAIYVTLAVGELDHFISIDPLREQRKWLAFCREDGGEVHWIPFSRLLKSDHI